MGSSPEQASSKRLLSLPGLSTLPFINFFFTFELFQLSKFNLRSSGRGLSNKKYYMAKEGL